MAYHQVDPAKIQMVVEWTDIRDEGLIARALQAKNGDVEQVANEFYEDSEKFKGKYSWDNSLFHANREGDIPVNTDVPSFVVHPADDQVLYGSDPGGYYASGAPSRPPSRANNRSPLSRMADMAASGYGVNNAQQQEDEDIKKAIAESLSQTPQPPTGPLPLQVPQQETGITSSGLSNPQFGPANRPEYDPNEWAMVQLKHNDPDPDPTRRTRVEGVPVFLRCRIEDSWRQHRVGGLLTVLHSIPAARNGFLRVGNEPPYGYGQDSEWWKGKAILPPEIQSIKEKWISEGQDVSGYLPPWTDELHRLIAFLDSTDRSYGTADILSQCRPDNLPDSGNPEPDFLESYSREHFLANSHKTDGDPTDRLFTTCAVLGSVGEETATIHNITHLDWNLGREALAGTESLYDMWDLLFFPDSDDLPSRAAAIKHPSEVMVFRFIDEEGFEQPVQIPETFYLDRYLEVNRDKIWRNLLDLQKISAAFKKSAALESSLTQWTNPKSNKTLDRRALIKKSIEECQRSIARIKSHAAWVAHELNPDDPNDFYLPEHGGEPLLDEKELGMIQHYEGKIRQMEKSLADMENTLNNVILPERDNLRKLSLKARRLFRDPAPDQGWHPTHKYTLRGVVSEANKIFLRKREPVLMEMEDDSPPAEQWIKLWTMADNDNAVLHEMVSFSDVLNEGMGRGKAPTLIYASEKAMAEEPEPLSNALKTFVKFDNRMFKQELLQSELYGSSREKKRGVNGIGSAFSSESKRRNRSNSIDSMATNQASAGDLDDDMRDGGYDLEAQYPTGMNDSMAMSLDGVIASDYNAAELQGELVDVSDSAMQGLSPNIHAKVINDGSADDPVDLLTPGPEEEKSSNTGYIARNSESPTIGRASLNLASVSLKGGTGANDNKEGGYNGVTPANTQIQSTQPQLEMQERGTIPLITRRDNTASMGSGPMDTTSDTEIE